MSAARFGLTEPTIEKIGGVLAQHPQVEQAVLYGSRAKGNYKNGSDIDLTLMGEELCHDDLLKLMGELDDLLLPYMIDLSIFHQLTHQDLIDYIRRVGVVFYEKRSNASHASTRQPSPI
ncbi:MAG: nucleotidyltransferase domain-containing protein [Verrucomicrobia bacterium]|nr:nucleotidyltransferase domain-containing protein [Verrucomicrobiota bacterium]